MAEQQMVELIQGMSSNDNNTREQATKMYKDGKNQNPEAAVTTLLKVIALAGVADDIKVAALVHLRTCLKKEDPNQFVFNKLQEPTKQQVAAGLLELFKQAANDKIQTKIGDAIEALTTYVCDVEDPNTWLVKSVDGAGQGWPTLLPAVMEMATATSNAMGSKNAFGLLKELVHQLNGQYVLLAAQMGQVIQTGLQCPELDVRMAAVTLVLSMVAILDKKDWAPLTQTMPVIVQVCEQLAAAGKNEDLQEIIEYLDAVNSSEPDFFKSSLQSSFQPAKLMSDIVKAHAASSDLRQAAMEWITSYAEAKPKFCVKSVPGYAKMALECAGALMLEIEDGQEELKAWAERMDDEEGEEDADELYTVGEECMDRLAENLTFEGIAGELFTIIQTFVQQPDWKAKHAALATIKQVIEYVEEWEHVKQMADLLISHANHEHPRVRYTALHAIGQLANDQAPQFQEAYHNKVIPMVMQMGPNDKIHRVGAMAISAFVSFAEELKDVLKKYSHECMEIFLQILQSTPHRGLREESITAIAVIAAVLDKDFLQYYDKTMPLLKQLIQTVVTEGKEVNQRLLGKAFECLSLLGESVDKQKFLPDATLALEAMLAGQNLDGVVKEYIFEAISRIVHILQKDFKPFLPKLLPGVFQQLDISQEGGLLKTGGNDQEYEVNIGGNLTKVKSSKFEEIASAASLISTLLEEMEDAYIEYIPQTALAFVPLLDMTGEVAELNEDARAVAFESWSLLVRANVKAYYASKAAGAPNAQAANHAVELMKKILAICHGLLTKRDEKGRFEEEDTDVLMIYARGMEQSLKEAAELQKEGVECLGQEEVKQILSLIMEQKMQQSFDEAKRIKALQAKNNAGVTQAELQPDEDDEERNPLDAQRDLRLAYEGVLGGLMKISPQAFVTLQSQFSPVLQGWLNDKENLVLGLHFSCDLLEYLKEGSQPFWPVFMAKVFESLQSKDALARTAGAYAVNLGSQVPAFAEAAPQAFQSLAKVVSGKKAKKKDDNEQCASDNAIAALFALARNMFAQKPPEIDAYGLCLSKMPLKYDKEEAKKVHKALVETFGKSDPNLLGANNQNLGKILGVLADVHKKEDISSKEIDGLIVQLFKALPAAMIQGVAGQLSEMQQSSIEKIMTSA